MFSLFAQIEAGVSWESLLAMLSGGGFSIWFGWYTTTKTLPKIVDDFREEMKLERESHAHEIEQLTTAFQSRMTSVTTPSNN